MKKHVSGVLITSLFIQTVAFAQSTRVQESVAATQQQREETRKVLHEQLVEAKVRLKDLKKELILAEAENPAPGRLRLIKRATIVGAVVIVVAVARQLKKTSSFDPGAAMVDLQAGALMLLVDGYAGFLAHSMEIGLTSEQVKTLRLQITEAEKEINTLIDAIGVMDK